MTLPDGQFPVSRDHAYELKCSNSDCFCNTKNGSCAAPSAVSITVNGKCKLYQTFIEKDKKMIELTPGNFDEWIGREKSIVYVWARWCAPCKTMSPIINEIADEFVDVYIAKYDCDYDTDKLPQFNIKGVPTLLFFKNGELVKSLFGGMPKEMIIEEIKNV